MRTTVSATIKWIRFLLLYLYAHSNNLFIIELVATGSCLLAHQNIRPSIYIQIEWIIKQNSHLHGGWIMMTCVSYVACIKFMFIFMIMNNCVLSMQTDFNFSIYLLCTMSSAMHVAHFCGQRYQAIRPINYPHFLSWTRSCRMDKLPASFEWSSVAWMPPWQCRGVEIGCPPALY